MSSAKLKPVEPAATEPKLPPPITVEIKVRLQAIALPEADGGYSIIVPALPGCASEADALEEIQANITDAAEGWLAVSHDDAKAEAIRVARGEE